MTIHHGDCLDVMAAMEPESVDAIVTDPPYGLEFMGKAWDHGVMGRPFADAMYRVAKPSAYLLAFGGTRTVHRMTVALEDAGWIIRDMLVWGYASGFPKSKASLKPAWEPIVMARKPGPLRMLAIDECRIGVGGEVISTPQSYAENRDASSYNLAPDTERLQQAQRESIERLQTLGRWPANIVLTDPIFDGGIEGVVGGGETAPAGLGSTRGNTIAPTSWDKPGHLEPIGYGDSGTYSRFFLIPKADRSDREPVLGGLATPICGCDGEHCGDGPTCQYVGLRDDPFAGTAHSKWCEACGKQAVNVPGSACQCAEPRWTTRAQRKRRNVHPTVKPTDLMRHLVRLVTPTGGVVLDPFLGSGTTGLAAEMEGFEWIGIEREAEYVAIAEARLNGTQRGLGLGA